MENEQIVEKVAEYLSIALFLTEFSPDTQYQRANCLVFELQMLLSNSHIRLLADTIQKKMLPSECVAAFREFYGNEEPLDKNRFMAHAPGVGKKEKQ